MANLSNKEVFLCILNNIPWDKGNPEWISKKEIIEAIDRNCHINDPCVYGYVESVIFVLELLDLIDTEDDFIRLKGQIPFYFINSLKWYSGKNQRLSANSRH